MSVFDIMAIATMAVSQPVVDGPAEPDAATTSEDQIIVTAPPTQAERRSQIRELAREVVREPRAGYPIGRFFLPVCPKVVGLSAIDAQEMEFRIRENARNFGPGERKNADCEPNLKVVFLAPSVGPADTWLDHDSESISHLLSYQKQRVLDEQGPVRAWNISMLRDADGRKLEANAGINNVRLNSRLTYSVTNEITGAMMLIEFDAAKDKTLKQLADYASVRAFVGTESVGSSQPLPVDTILSLFSDAAAPEELTEFDQALITKLYSLPRNASTAKIFGAVAARAVNLEEGAEEEGG